MILRNRKFDFSSRPYLMGVLNVTPDSFSDGARFFETERAVSQGLKMADEGADIIDIGGESSRPGAEPVEAGEEMRRVIPVIEKIALRSPVPLSIDTTKSVVAREALRAGASLINDISGLTGDPGMLSMAAEMQCPVCIMHMKGDPGTMQHSPRYSDVVAEIRSFLEMRIRAATDAGVLKSNILVDPGIGFGKRVLDNLVLINRLREFLSLGCPLLIGASRKSFIGTILKNEDPGQRLYGTLGCVAMAVLNGASVLRVHDVRPAREMLTVMRAIREEKAEPGSIPG